MCDTINVRCEGSECNTEFPSPIGDGSVVHRRDMLGGHYFCSEACASHWDREKEITDTVLYGHDTECHFPISGDPSEEELVLFNLVRPDFEKWDWPE